MSCNKTEDVKTVDSQRSPILSFSSEEDFFDAVKSIKQGVQTKSLINQLNQDAAFISLYHEYDEAMENADDYYQREGGYEEFKARFPHLYYPEYGEDYSAFLPVKDEDVAKLLNPEGKVIIDGDERDYRDIWSYDQLLELGLGMPEYEDGYNVTTKTLSDVYTLTVNKQEINSKRKAWITRRGILLDTDLFGLVKYGRLDLCFRKKGILGWYNGKLSSRLYVIRPDHFGPSFVKHYSEIGPYVDKASPHKYLVAARLEGSNELLGSDTFYFETDYEDNTYSFTGRFPENLDALLDLNNGLDFWEQLGQFFSGTAGAFYIGFNF